MTDTSNEWYHIGNANEIDSPALVIYPEIIKENIRLLIGRVKDVATLRPHVKTHKMAEVCRLQIQQGISKFKCATIAEAEMLAMEGARDVLLAYQPVGPKIERLIKLIKRYRETEFSCLVDNSSIANAINEACFLNGLILKVFIDLNIGMNRTGISTDNAFALYKTCMELPCINAVGLHAYDGHINDTEITVRQAKSDIAFEPVKQLANKIFKQLHTKPKIIIGGSPSFATHFLRDDAELSPGTFIFWDYGYQQRLPQEPYHFAALVITRIISIIDNHTICTDLGHKAVAAENPLPRVHFLNAPMATPVGQSEEHLMVTVISSADYKVGDLLYGIPVHICPTVALYERAITIENKMATGEWAIRARDRKINI